VNQGKALFQPTAIRSRTAPSGPATNTGVPAPPRSRTAARSSSGTAPPAVTTAAASSARAPDATAIATAVRSALSLNDGNSTVPAT